MTVAQFPPRRSRFDALGAPYLAGLHVFPCEHAVFPEHIAVAASFLRDGYGAGVYIIYTVGFGEVRYMGMAVAGFISTRAVLSRPRLVAA